jgi:hypothetical protein
VREKQSVHRASDELLKALENGRANWQDLSGLHTALGISSSERKEKEIGSLTRNAPLKNWIEGSKSFEDFYDEVWNMAKAVHARRDRRS